MFEWYINNLQWTQKTLIRSPNHLFIMFVYFFSNKYMFCKQSWLSYCALISTVTKKEA